MSTSDQPAETIEVPALTAATSRPSRFLFGEVRATPRTEGAAPATPNLGPLGAFVGNWHGSGFNTIFRPDNSQTPTSQTLPHPLPPGDNVLELNLTSETLSFSAALGSVPNRGEVQGDIFLNGVPYLQSIEDITSGKPIGIHLEPGLWIAVPSTSAPAEGATLARMASIPHGTTINAQGSSRSFPGAPTIPAVDITPFAVGSPGSKIRFPSQQASNAATARIPQDLSAFITTGTITQAMLDDPNSVLRAHISGQSILSTTEISISTAPSSPLFGGGSENIAFLLGFPQATSQPNGPGQNAQTVQTTATFWIELVEHTIVVPPFELGHPPLTLRPEPPVVTAGHPQPSFVVRPPVPIPRPRPITVTSPQIQYTQTVELDFNTLTWPHVSVATLVPAGPITVPPSVWS